jgi:hypothetical protein
MRRRHESAGGEIDAPSIDAGDGFAFCGRLMCKPRFG